MFLFITSTNFSMDGRLVMTDLLEALNINVLHAAGVRVYEILQAPLL